jgi:hypothetical protein
MSYILSSPSLHLAFVILEIAITMGESHVEIRKLVNRAKLFDVLVSVSPALEGDNQLKALHTLIKLVNALDTFPPSEISKINFDKLNHIQLIFGARFLAEHEHHQPLVNSLYCQSLATLMVELSSHVPVRLGGEVTKHVFMFCLIANGSRSHLFPFEYIIYTQAADAVELLMEVSEIIESIDDHNDLPSYVYAEVTSKMFSDTPVDPDHAESEARLTPLFDCESDSREENETVMQLVNRGSVNASPCYTLSPSAVCSFNLKGVYSYFHCNIQIEEPSLSIMDSGAQEGGMLIRIMCDGAIKLESVLNSSNKEVLSNINSPYLHFC